MLKKCRFEPRTPAAIVGFCRGKIMIVWPENGGNANEIGGKNSRIWVKYHLEKWNEKTYNNFRKSAETRFETVFVDV